MWRRGLNLPRSLSKNKVAHVGIFEAVRDFVCECVFLKHGIVRTSVIFNPKE